MTRVRGSYDRIIIAKERHKGKNLKKGDKPMANDTTKNEIKKLGQKYDEFMKKLKDLEERLSQSPPDDKHLEAEIEQLKKKMEEILIRVEELKDKNKREEPLVKKEEQKKADEEEPDEDKSIFI